MSLPGIITEFVAFICFFAMGYGFLLLAHGLGY